MNRTIQHYTSGCVFIVLLFLVSFTYGQIKTKPTKCQKRVVTNVELKSSNFISHYSAARMESIQSGNWIASTGTGFNFDFVVNDDATQITQLAIKYTDWTCGSVKHSGGVTYGSTWLITDRKFTIYKEDSYSNKKITIKGTFGSNGTQASGSWVYKSDYGECSGTWSAVPEGGAVQLPDLVVTSIEFDPSSGTTGSNLNVSLTVKNNGSADAGSSILKCYLSINDTISDLDIYMGSKTVPTLASGDSSNVSITREITSDLADGMYYVGCITDADEQVDETNENKYYYLSNPKFEKLSTGHPDLITTTGSFAPEEGGVGTELYVHLTVKNIGQYYADTSTVAFYLNVNPDDQDTDIFIGLVKIPGLNAGDEFVAEISYEIPNTLPAGSYYTEFAIDFYNSVEESDESNFYYLPGSQFIRLSDPDLIVLNEISDIVLYKDSIDFTFDLNASPAIFNYSNPDVSLSYSISSSVGTIASTSISGSIFTISPLSEGTAIITVTAYDGIGNSVSTNFCVEVKNKQSNPPWWGCLVLGGNGDFAEAEDQVELDLGDESGESITVEAWVNFSNFTSADIIIKPDAYRLYTETYTNMGYQFRSLGFNLRSGITTSIVALGTTIYGGGFWNEGWHHVAGVYDKGSGNMSLYMDGEQLHESHYGDIEVNNSDQALRVGSNLNGCIDEMRISDNARYTGLTYAIPTEPFTIDDNTRTLWHFDEPKDATECHDCSQEDNLLLLQKGAYVTSIESFEEQFSDQFELLQNYPNPFKSSTTIRFNVFKPAHISIKIYNILGSEINTLADKNYPLGLHEISWEGRDNIGLPVKSGLYMLQMQSDQFIMVKKMLMQFD
jgi:hypothetical protein